MAVPVKMPLDCSALASIAVSTLSILAPAYGTEELVGEAIKAFRGKVILSTKAALGPYLGPFDGSRIASKISARIGEDTSFVLSGRVLEKRVNASLHRLKTDYIDVFYLHTVTPAQYALALDRLVPTFNHLKESGQDLLCRNYRSVRPLQNASDADEGDCRQRIRLHHDWFQLSQSVGLSNCRRSQAPRDGYHRDVRGPKSA